MSLREESTSRKAAVVQLRLGDSLEVIKTLKPDAIKAVITDPPYG